jgi:methylenetetrahydrofolate--tRNA-(uracil-5-)-methyltransferase
MASRGIETLRFGPMKPVGLTDPRNNERPYAVVQLRQDNLPATLYNIVGFQTKLKYGEQSHLFRQIPGLENTEFARLGGIHRNSFINSPTVLTKDLSLRNKDNIKFAGQITGVEGYIESTSIGLLAGLLASRKILGAPIILPPEESAIGSLLAHITINANKELFQPMNINFGLFPDPKVKNKKDKKAEISNRAIESIKKWKELIAD